MTLTLKFYGKVFFFFFLNSYLSSHWQEPFHTWNHNITHIKHNLLLQNIISQGQALGLGHTHLKAQEVCQALFFLKGLFLPYLLIWYKHSWQYMNMLVCSFMQMKPHPQSDLQRKVTDIILHVRWASTSSGKLCCQATALVYFMCFCLNFMGLLLIHDKRTFSSL